ncbi:SMC family ATPase [Streptomyces durbertensis]|uniref:Nuclease SbcCD subunit C n=1 Tax=Streptomyces durbertensis TaxID=2448886 RepID=A0ABR6EEZ4_9ACTN|nr:SMC family ATPase [Streptomyces durbertensis]MBB1243891.1 SMC family ATPase [Streptomyces durbertensis]
MRLHRLTLRAFGPFAGTEHVDFDALSTAGLFLLHGATGAGKTSVLDAVCYALYGAVPGARQASRGRVRLRSDHAAPTDPTEVVLELTVGGRRLEITRRPEQSRPKRRGGGTTVDKAQTLLREYRTATGDWRALSRSHQEVGEEVRGLLGMSREQFCQVVLLPQGDFARFLRSGAEERAQLLGRLFDTSRFTAVEQRLADERATAQRALRSADEKLLALTQRMWQAVAEEDGRPAAGLLPPPEPTTGEAGLADAVLRWAAHAREHAAERAARGRVARSDAEAAHTAARQDLAELAETARRQRRHADALARAGVLADAAEERERLRQALARSRAAEQVVPLLRLRDDAADEHRAAEHAERDARAALPEPHRDAAAEHLTEAEHRARSRLGALAAARRAAERANRLTAELARLERQAEADETQLADAERWLADWPALQEQLRRRVADGQEAAADATRLTAELETARRRARAAAERDRLTGELDTAEAALLLAREAAATARDRWLDHRERRLLGIAAELAAHLTPGEPCGVCGSPDHPAPAGESADHVSRADEDRALAGHRAAEERREAAQRALDEVRRRRRSETEQAGDTSLPDLRADVERLSAELAAAERAAGQAGPARQALERAEREYNARLAARREAGDRVAAHTSRREALLAERDALAAEFDEPSPAGGGGGGVAERAEALARLADALAAAAAAVERAGAAADRAKEVDARLDDAVWRAGFHSAAEAAAALLPESRQREVLRRLDEWQGEERALAAEFADERLRAAAALPPVDLPVAEARAARAERLLRAADTRAAAADTAHRALTRLSREATAGARAVAPLRRRADRISRLATLTAGTSTENSRRMRLESYVLAARLEQVAAAAGVRLHRMSAGRYTLVHSDELATHGARSGLGLHVVDAWTGRERDTATLSGGETFSASLALALGLADVVAEEAGGTRLDTLFIDEGFGTLDEETLEEVLSVLDALRERDRSVGIVSHVAELRLRVPAQLEVVKHRHGSTLRHRV